MTLFREGGPSVVKSCGGRSAPGTHRLRLANPDYPQFPQRARNDSVPYSVELNDINLFLSNGMSGDDFYRMVVDQFDQLYDDSAQSGRVMALALHPFIIGQPFRARHLSRALQYIASHEGVWLTTSDEIAENYLTTTGPA
jgi:allantoinase